MSALMAGCLWGCAKPPSVPRKPQAARSAKEWRSKRTGGELRLYRDRTVALLKRYFRHSLEIGRLPSLLGREFFRARVTSYRMHTFEEAVIFAHDVEACLALLDLFSRELVANILMQEYTRDETASLLGCSRRTIAKRLPKTLDRLTEMFLARGLLAPLAANDELEVACQGPESGDLAVSISAHTK